MTLPRSHPRTSAQAQKQASPVALVSLLAHWTSSALMLPSAVHAPALVTNAEATTSPVNRPPERGRGRPAPGRCRSSRRARSLFRRGSGTRFAPPSCISLDLTGLAPGRLHRFREVVLKSADDHVERIEPSSIAERSSHHVDLILHVPICDRDTLQHRALVICDRDVGDWVPSCRGMHVPAEAAARALARSPPGTSRPCRSCAQVPA
jgi:hypothetical protein